MYPHFTLHTSRITFLLKIIIVDFDTEHDATTRRRHQIRQKQRPQHVGLVQNALQHEAEATNGHHQKSRQGDVVGLACPNRPNCLRQIAQNHSDARHPSAHLIKEPLFHFFVVFGRKGSDLFPNMAIHCKKIKKNLHNCQKHRNFAAANRKRYALVAELADAPDLGSGVSRREGSSPFRRTSHATRAVFAIVGIAQLVRVSP